MTAKLSPMRRIACDALNLFNPAACRESTYERDIQDLTELLEALTRSPPRQDLGAGPRRNLCLCLKGGRPSMD